ncbi:MAG: hypothetical protein KZQ60_19565, partial [Candidatus Thiodiazotropha sp. (ex Lucinoma aequizonata)]|nr:hypothetical protein [Candidatus Thiodiazotropha sp. (ex Lucinoma aequizonata)]
SIMTTAMTLRRLGCALCMPFISPLRSPFRPCNRAYAYRGLTAFAPLSMAVSGGKTAHIVMIFNEILHLVLDLNPWTQVKLIGGDTYS